MAKDTSRSQTGSNGLVRFVNTKGTLVAGRHIDKAERITETVRDLELACEGAFSLIQRTERINAARWVPALARLCSVFLRKTVIGDRNDPSTRLLDDSVIQSLGIGFDKLRKIPSERYTIDLQMSFDGGMTGLHKIDEMTGQPEAIELLPIAPHDLQFAIEWPLPGTGGWTEPPTEDYPWTIAPGELFDLDGKEKIDCSSWLDQQLVMFDHRGITLKDVIRKVATYEGAHSINVSRLLQTEDEEPERHFRHPEIHILDNVTVFGVKYTHIVVIECALYLYEMLADGGHIERLADDEWKLRLSFVALDKADFFSRKQNWLVFTGGLILAFGTAKKSISHRIRAVR